MLEEMGKSGPSLLLVSRADVINDCQSCCWCGVIFRDNHPQSVAESEIISNGYQWFFPIGGVCAHSNSQHTNNKGRKNTLLFTLHLHHRLQAARPTKKCRPRE